MSRWLALASSTQFEKQASPDSMTKPDKTPSRQPEGVFCQVLSNVKRDELVKVSKPERLSVGGRPMTDPGRIVSFEEWAEIASNRPAKPPGAGE